MTSTTEGVGEASRGSVTGELDASTIGSGAASIGFSVSAVSTPLEQLRGRGVRALPSGVGEGTTGEI